MGSRPQAVPTSSLLALVAAIAAAVIALVVSSASPGKALATFFGGPLANRYAFGNMLAYAGTLLFTGTGVVVAFRAGVFNLGGEGQVYLGAILTAVALNGSVGIPESFGWAGILLVVIATGTLAGISGAARVAFEADELITSFLLSSAVFPVVDYLIVGPLRDKSMNLLATPPIWESYRLPRLLPPSQLTTALLWGMLAVVLLWAFLRFTLPGYEMRIVGLNREMAKHAGLPVTRYTILPMFLSGALHGMAGAALVMGTHHRAISGFSGGLGWNGIAVALIARNRPVLVIPAALFFAYLNAGSNATVLQNQATWAVGSLVQAVVFLFVTAEALGRYRNRRARPTHGPGSGTGNRAPGTRPGRTGNSPAGPTMPADRGDTRNTRSAPWPGPDGTGANGNGSDTPEGTER